MHRTMALRLGRSLSLSLAASLLASAVVAQSDPPAAPVGPSNQLGEPGPLSAGTYHGQLGTGQWTVSVPDGWEWFYDIL
jgi:hypothetical protein